MESSSNLPVGVGEQMSTVVIFDKKKSCSQGGDLEEKFELQFTQYVPIMSVHSSVSLHITASEQINQCL